MVKILEVQQQIGKMHNFQSRIVEFDSFSDYLFNVDSSLPREENLEVYKKYIDFENKTITFMFEHKIHDAWIEFSHFAQVVSQ